METWREDGESAAWWEELSGWILWQPATVLNKNANIISASPCIKTSAQFTCGTPMSFLVCPWRAESPVNACPWKGKCPSDGEHTKGPSIFPHADLCASCPPTLLQGISFEKLAAVCQLSGPFLFQLHVVPFYSIFLFKNSTILLGGEAQRGPKMQVNYIIGC